MQDVPLSAKLTAEANDWERRSLAATSFPDMVEFQRRADRCAALAREPDVRVTDTPEAEAPAKQHGC